MHTHDMVETFLVISGKWKLEWELDTGGEYTILEPLDFMACPVGVQRRFECVESAPDKDEGLILGMIAGELPAAEASPAATRAWSRQVSSPPSRRRRRLAHDDAQMSQRPAERGAADDGSARASARLQRGRGASRLGSWDWEAQLPGSTPSLKACAASLKAACGDLKPGDGRVPGNASIRTSPRSPEPCKIKLNASRRLLPSL